MKIAIHRVVLAMLLALASPDTAAKRPTMPSIAEKTRGMEAREGLFRFHVDTTRGKIWLEVPPPRGERGIASEFLYVAGLRTGLGSNPVGLDRGQLGTTRWVVLRRIGPRVLLEQLNPAFRADSDDPAERRAARESFATSVLWGQDIEALDPDGRALVDLSSFLIRDAHGVSKTLVAAKQGVFKLDSGRSTVDFAQCLAFPDNLEFDVLLTYGGTEPGEQLRRTAPSPDSLTLVQHHSWIRLPDDDYSPRRFDPRAGSFDIAYQDYSTDLGEPLRRQWIARHRLQRVDATAERSPARQPIVFYVDRGAPEPVRNALIDGAGWWAKAFEAAGFLDGFRVELLPEGAHALDVRYNVIQWVHRATRGWSYGGGIIDPRTGEILKGHVLLGSLRVRQDRLLFEGLAGTDNTGSGKPDDPIELALARIRQLAAHEVGHALGLTHNFSASTYAGRASVMDYPAPLVAFDARGELDFSNAYGVGVGAWDRHAIRYAYSEFSPGTDENEALDAIVRTGIKAGYLFLTDEAARPTGASDPRANLWDNGADPVDALLLTMQVRRHALNRFGETNVARGTPLAHLEEVLAPVYFYHRYQLDAAVKVLGGMSFHYAVRGDGQFPTRIVPAERQWKALDAVLRLLSAQELDLPDSIVSLLAPRPHGESLNREMFATQTAPAFDALGAAGTAAALVLDGLLQPERLGRLAAFQHVDPELPGLDEVLDRLIVRVFDNTSTEGSRHAEIERVVRSVFVGRLVDLAQRRELRSTLRARIEASLRRIRDRLVAIEESDTAGHAEFLAGEISRFLDRPAGSASEPWMPERPPPGSPIGSPPTVFGNCGQDFAGTLQF